MMSDKENGFALSSTGQPRLYPLPEPEPEPEPVPGEQEQSVTQEAAAGEGTEEAGGDQQIPPAVAPETSAASVGKQSLAPEASAGTVTTGPVEEGPGTADAAAEPEEPAPVVIERPPLPTFLSHPVAPTDSSAEVPWMDAAPCAPAVPPRLFVVYETGDGYEVLPTWFAEQYIAERRKDPGCVVSVVDVPADSPDGGRSVTTILTPVQLLPRQPQALPIAFSATNKPAPGVQALQSMKRPTVFSPPPPANGLAMPRVACVQPPLPRAPLEAPLLRLAAHYPLDHAQTPLCPSQSLSLRPSVFRSV